MIRVLLDSGAYGAWRRGDHIDLDNYIAFVKRNGPLIESYVNLDVISGSAGRIDWRPEAIEQAAWQSYANLQKMKDAGLRPIPVFHQGEHFKWLERMLKDGEKYIGLSPVQKQPRTETLRWLDRTFSVLKHHPDVRTHGFGVASFPIRTGFPWTSVDASTWMKAAGFGRIPVLIMVGDGHYDHDVQPDLYYVTDGTRHLPRHLDDLDAVDLDLVERYLNDIIGVDLAEARYDLYARWRTWVGYLQAIPTSCTIHFVTNANDGQQALTLDDHGVQHRLLSYFDLRDARDSLLEDYVHRRRCTTSIKRSSRVQPWSQTYVDARRLAQWRRWRNLTGPS